MTAEVNQTVFQYVVIWSLFFFVVGTGWYNFDRRFGVKIYRVWYNLTHKNKMTNDEQRGFIFNRTIKARMTAAFIVSTVQSILAWHIQVNPLAEIVMWLLEIPIMVIGFYCGPFTYSLWQKKETLFNTIDDIENGRRDLGEEASAFAHGTVDRIKKAATDHVVDPVMEAVDEVKGQLSGSGSTPDEPVNKPETISEEDQAVLDTDPEELMNKFLNRRK